MSRVSNKHIHHGIKIKQVLHSPTKFLFHLCEDLSKFTELLLLHERGLSVYQSKKFMLSINWSISIQQHKSQILR